MDTGAVVELPVRPRHIALDERGVGLRATWHEDRGFVNVSLWSGDRCVQTFHLSPVEAGRLVASSPACWPTPCPSPPVVRWSRPCPNRARSALMPTAGRTVSEASAVRSPNRWSERLVDFSPRPRR